MLYIVLPLYWQESGLDSLVQVGVILSVNRFVRVPLNPLISIWYRRLNVRNGFIIASCLAIITTAAYGFAQDFYIWIINRCLWGLAWTLLRLGAFNFILDISSEHNRGQLIGLYNGYFRIGSLIGMFVGGGLADVFGLSKVSYAFAAACFLLLPVLLKRVPAVTGSHALLQQKNADTAQPLLQREEKKGWMFVTALGWAFVFEGAFNSTLSRLSEDKFHSVAMFGIVFGGASIAGFIQALRWGWGPFVSPAVGRLAMGSSNGKLPLGISLIVGAVLFALIAAELPSPLTFCIILGVLITSTCNTTLMDEIAASIAMASGSRKRTVMSTYTMLLDLGAALGPLIVYWLLQYISTASIYIGSSGLLFLLSIRWVLIHFRPKSLNNRSLQRRAAP